MDTDDAFTILLAEDDENDIWFVQKALIRAEMGNPIQVVRDGHEVIDYLSGKNKFSDRNLYPLPKLMLLDIRMPKRDGFDVLQCLQNQEDEGLKRLPVIIMSASGLQWDIDRAYDLGVSAFLVKPSSFDDLVKTLRTTTEFWKDIAAHPQV